MVVGNWRAGSEVRGAPPQAQGSSFPGLVIISLEMRRLEKDWDAGLYVMRPLVATMQALCWVLVLTCLVPNPGDRISKLRK